MLIDKVAIANMALANIGQPPIQSFESTSVAARSIKQRYDEARLACLAAAPWNFASLWAAGVAVAMDPKPGWSYVFQYPPDALRVFEILRATVDDKTIPFEVTANPSGTGKLIHANVPTPVFVYTVDKEDVSTFDWEFIEAMSWLIAHKVAMPITKSLKMQENAMKGFTALADKALARTRNEGVDDTDITPSYQMVR